VGGLGCGDVGLVVGMFFCGSLVLVVVGLVGLVGLVRFGVVRLELVSEEGRGGIV